MMLAFIEGQQQLPTQRVATNVLADDKKVQAKVAKKLAKQQVHGHVSIDLYINYILYSWEILRL